MTNRLMLNYLDFGKVYMFIKKHLFSLLIKQIKETTECGILLLLLFQDHSQ